MKIRQLGLIVPGLLLVLVSAGTAARAQGPGSVIGKVTLDGKPVRDAVVKIKSLDTPREQEDKTDKNGEYLFRVMAGRYEITVKIEGKDVARLEVNIRGGAYGEISSENFRNRFDIPVTTQRPGEGGKAAQQDEESEKLQAGFDKGVALNKEGKYQEALAELEPLLQKDPEQWVFHYQMAVAYMGLGRNDDAVAAYQKAIQLNPTHAGLYNALGQLYIKMNRVEDAKKQFEAAAQISPEEAGAYYYNLGVTFYNAGDLKSAIEPLRKATELDPTRADAFYWLGVCLYSTAEYKQEGNELKTIIPPGTREAFEQYLVLAPEGKYANDAKAMLQALDQTVPASVRVRKK